MGEGGSGPACVFCGGSLERGWRVFVHLPDGAEFACCPTACAPLLSAIEERKRAVEAARGQMALPLAAG
jgi:hypothetical protein